MKILVIGSGGREHAICHAFFRSRKVSKIFCAPGNAGIAEIAKCIQIKSEEIDALANFAVQENVDLTFVGGETTLALGIVDEFENRGLKIVGPSKAASQLEASKAFAKDFMARHGVPTAQYKTAYSTHEAIEILEEGEFGDEETPVVIKADGLAAGKGVVVARDRAEAIAAINEMARLVGHDAAEKIVIEECLVGREVSLLMFTDGEHFALMPPTRDHKRIGEGDTGPNTGGMGTITDASLLSEKQTNAIIKTIIEPTLNGCRDEGFPFRGILFLGLMVADDTEARASARAKTTGKEPHIALTNVRASAINVLEYNVRFGDPETQSILVRLETDLVDICNAMLGGDRVSSPTVREGASLAELEIRWKPGSSATVVLAAKGYPQKPQKGDPIHGLNDAAKIGGVTIFHAGTALSEPPAVAGGLMSDVRNFITSGGRVLGVTATGNDLTTALSRAYEAVGTISWEGMQYRRDIGNYLSC